MISSPWSPIVREAVMSSGDERRRVEDEAQKLTTSQRSPLWLDLCQLLVGASRRASPLRKQSGELVLFQRQRLRWIQLDYWFVSFQTSQKPLILYWGFTLASCFIRYVSFHVRTNQQKLTSPSGYVLVYDSAGEPARESVRGSGEESASGSEFEVGGANSEDVFPRRASWRAPLAAVAES